MEQGLKNYSPLVRMEYAKKKAQVAKENNFWETGHTDWAAAHENIKQEISQQRERAGQCMRCGIIIHTGKQY